VKGVRNTLAAKKLVLLWTGSPKYFCPDSSCYLDGSLPNTASSSMNKNGLALLESCHIRQAIVRGQECDRDGSCFMEVEVLWNGSSQDRGDVCPIAESAHRDRNHPISRLEFSNLRPHPKDDPGTFVAESAPLCRRKRINVKCLENIPEVHSDGSNIDLDLMRG
jgi:hypothetical protein